LIGSGTGSAKDGCTSFAAVGEAQEFGLGTAANIEAALLFAEVGTESQLSAGGTGER
jgi:hypothetical protein